MFDWPRSKRDPVHRERSGVPQNGGNEPPTVEMGVLVIGRGVAYRKTDETDLCWSATVETGRGVWRTAKRDSTGYCSSPPATSSSLHGLLFIHRRPPLASTCDCSSTGSYSSSLHRALLHRLLFNQPSTGYYSSSPPRGPVHPSPTGSIDRGPVHPEATPWGPVHPPPPGTVHPNPPSNTHYSSRGSIDRLQLAAVAKESLDRVQLTAIDRSLGFSNA